MGTNTATTSNLGMHAPMYTVAAATPPYGSGIAASTASWMLRSNDATTRRDTTSARRGVARTLNTQAAIAPKLCLADPRGAACVASDGTSSELHEFAVAPSHARTRLDSQNSVISPSCTPPPSSASNARQKVTMGRVDALCDGGGVPHTKRAHPSGTGECRWQPRCRVLTSISSNADRFSTAGPACRPRGAPNPRRLDDAASEQRRCRIGSNVTATQATAVHDSRRGHALRLRTFNTTAHI